MVELKLKKTYHQSKHIFYFIFLLLLLYYILFFYYNYFTKQMHLRGRN